MIADAPSSNRSNGRDAKGRFAQGNPGGPGNPHARRTSQLRSVYLEAVSEDDIRAIAAKMVEQAKAGDMVAAKEVLDRTTGKAGIDQIQLLQVAIASNERGLARCVGSPEDYLAEIRRLAGVTETETDHVDETNLGLDEYVLEKSCSA